MKNIELFKCLSTETIVDAMKKININSYGLVYVVDDMDRLIGCVTDGDLRRWIIKSGNIKAHVDKAMNSAPIYVLADKRDDGVRLMAEKQISSVAVIDDRFHIVDVMFSARKLKEEFVENALIDTPIIVMAGGRGTRLSPYTKILPKPLIPIKEIPILERILNRFTKFGAKKFYITINYRKEMIKSYFSEISHDYQICFVEEESPLGTAGSIRLIEDRFNNPIVVTNCDILIEADYNDILKHHKDSGNDITIVSSLINTVIPYGVLQTMENGIVTSMEEKPEISHFVNTGMYVINPEYIKWIPQGEPYHMTQLVDELIKRGKQVGMYPISENSFLDMGEFDEMKKMEERLNIGFSE